MRAELGISGRNRGFTLIEVMIVVAIGAILAAIAFPSYARYVEQARRADAKAALLDAAQRLERCHTQFNAYDHPQCPDFPVPSPDNHYEIDVVRDAMTFTLTATRQGVQANSPCGDYRITNIGPLTVINNSLSQDRCL